MPHSLQGVTAILWVTQESDQIAVSEFDLVMLLKSLGFVDSPLALNAGMTTFQRSISGYLWGW